MSDSMPFADIIIIALVAGFILLRLRSVLGQNTGFDGSSKPMNPEIRKKEDIIIQLADKLKSVKQEAEQKQVIELIPDDIGEEDKKAIEEIKKADLNFSVNEFTRGAKGAFEMVFDAFLKNDKQTLEMLLAPDLAKEFIAAASKRLQEENISETTLVAVESANIKSASFNSPIARVTLAILSEQVTVVRNKEGKIIEGDASRVERVEDIWVFERDINSKNPNWKIIDT